MQVALLGADLPNGLTNYRLNSAATTNATNLKNKAGRICGICITNTSAAVKFVKFYDKATAPTVGTDNPIFTIGVPANSHAYPYIPCGLFFSLGISFAITGLGTVADTTAVAANDVILNLQYA
jgi:hypothetical protein